MFAINSTVTGKCSTCGRKNVTGVVYQSLGNGMANITGSTHSHLIRGDDGNGRGNGAVRVERAEKSA